MAGITHSIVATGVDSGDQVSRDAWNAEHIVPDGALAQAKIAGLVSALAALAPLLDAALTGTPTAPTAAAATNTTQIATTAFVRTEVANLVASAPGALNTLDELAAALGDDANYAATVTAALAAKQPLADLLTAIAALDGTAGILRQTGAGTLVRLADTAAGRALLVAADAAAQRTALGLGTAALVNTGTGAADVPTTAQADARYAAIGAGGGISIGLAAALAAGVVTY
jgi:hypothetical protein